MSKPVCVKTWLASPKLLHWTLLAMMLLLIAGTVAQKYIGLYDAIRLFFSAPVIWLGPFPLPGFPIVLGVMAINITAKLIWKSEWSIQKAGVILSHLAVAFLLIGGALTAVSSREAYVDLKAGQAANVAIAYHQRIFVVRDAQTGATVYQHAFDGMSLGERIVLSDLGIAFEIIQRCRNCTVSQRPKDDARYAYAGLAKQMMLDAAPVRKADEENISGASVLLHPLSSLDPPQDPAFLTLIEDAAQQQEISNGAMRYRIALEKERHTLPFSITALDVRRMLHPGTQMAKSYETRVQIEDEYGQWEATIRMNDPLRYRGYTLFQSSFVSDPDGDVSVLAVVWNVGRAFPYIAGLILCLGLALHMHVRKA